MVGEFIKGNVVWDKLAFLDGMADMGMVGLSEDVAETDVVDLVILLDHLCNGPFSTTPRSTEKDVSHSPLHGG